ncbi:hypothetical protein ACF0H5_008161 [Mactra antiquata]
MAKLFGSIILCVLVMATKAEIEIPEYVYEKCRYVDICNRTATATPPADKVSCCKPCSCNETCGLNLNCCFDYLDKYKLVETGKVQCIQPIIAKKKKSSIETSSFYMVVSCSYLDPILQNVTGDCHLFDKTNRSLLAPVTNLKSKTTYVNEACAKCNNVNTFVPWNYYYLGDRTYGKNVASLMWTIQISFELQSGHKVFSPPRKAREAIVECFNKFIPTECEVTSPFHNICRILNMPYTMSSVSKYSVFTSVGCYPCRTSALNVEEKYFCEKIPFFRSLSSVVLAVLLDRTIVDSLEMKSGSLTIYSSRGKCPPETLKSRIRDRCLPVYCPEGMYRSSKGCKYLFLSWNIGGITMQVKLIPTASTVLPVSTLQSLSVEDLNKPQRWIKTPCDKLEPFYHNIYYENASLQFVNSFVVKLMKFTADDFFSPAYGIPLLARCTKEPWHIHLNNNEYKFTPQLSKFVDYVQDGRTTIKSASGNNEVDFFKPKIYDVLIENDKSYRFARRPEINIKKTFLCEQVRLTLDEVELGIEEVHVLASNKTLGNSEYDFNDISFVDKSYDANYSSVTICIDDYVTQISASGKPLDEMTRYVFLRHFIIAVLDILAVANRRLVQ